MSFIQTFRSMLHHYRLCQRITSCVPHRCKSATTRTPLACVVNKSSLAQYSSKQQVIFIPVQSCNFFLQRETTRLNPTWSVWRYYSVRMPSKKDKAGKSKGKSMELTSEEIDGIIDPEKIKAQLQQVLDHLKENYIKNMSLRTSTGIFDSLMVETEDGKFPLNQLAQIGQKNPQLVIINMPSSPQYIPAVKKAIQNSGMNVHPQQDGSSIFVPIPKVTREHREGLAKSAKTLCEQAKVKMRDVMKKYHKDIQKAEKSHSQDLIQNLNTFVKQILDDHIEEAEKLMTQKRQELLGDQ
ncbi:hypothetical protein CHS0354_037560 [Potamilus streckersoni]|uniref:Ribosome-recycling factor, mitochondrial n=1 Tax=Potamilus streckersoni TaxID=2493646 RepID=A0AAE0SFI1_9BIVA|nr:hypothetical protein CHS0354_037560 [Potamilus streckersoni]